jgi:hypothetical protein
MSPRSRPAWPAVDLRIRRRRHAPVIRRRHILPPLTLRWRLRLQRPSADAPAPAMRAPGVVPAVHKHYHWVNRPDSAWMAAAGVIWPDPGLRTIERIVLRLPRSPLRRARMPGSAWMASAGVIRPDSGLRTIERIVLRLPRSPLRQARMPGSPMTLWERALMAVIRREITVWRRPRVDPASAQTTPDRGHLLQTLHMAPPVELLQAASRFESHRADRTVSERMFFSTGISALRSPARTTSQPRTLSDPSPPGPSSSSFRPMLRWRAHHRRPATAPPPIESARRSGSRALPATGIAGAPPIVWRRAVAATAGATVARREAAASPDAYIAGGTQLGSRPAEMSAPEASSAISAPSGMTAVAPPPRAEARLEPAIIDLLAADVMRRIDRRARIERERRGL